MKTNKQTTETTTTKNKNNKTQHSHISSFIQILCNWHKFAVALYVFTDILSNNELWWELLCDLSLNPLIQINDSEPQRHLSLPTGVPIEITICHNLPIHWKRIGTSLYAPSATASQWGLKDPSLGCFRSIGFEYICSKKNGSPKLIIRREMCV